MLRCIGILVVIAFIIFIVLKDIVSNIKIKPDLKAMDLGGSVQSFLQGDAMLKTDVGIEVDNNNRFSIPISNLYIKIYHNGTLIAETDGIDKSIILIPAKGEKEFTHPLNVILVPSFFDAIKEITEDKPLILDYKIKGQLFKIPVKFENSFEYIKK